MRVPREERHGHSRERPSSLGPTSHWAAPPLRAVVPPPGEAPLIPPGWAWTRGRSVQGLCAQATESYPFLQEPPPLHPVSPMGGLGVTTSGRGSQPSEGRASFPCPTCITAFFKSPGEDCFSPSSGAGQRGLSASTGTGRSFCGLQITAGWLQQKRNYQCIKFELALRNHADVCTEHYSNTVSQAQQNCFYAVLKNHLSNP